MTTLLFCLLLQRGDEIRHEFVFRPEVPVTSVAVAGTFNNWSSATNPLKLEGDGRTWRLALPLLPGKYQYKFVLDGNNWITDPKASRNEDDGNGNQNSVLVILPPDYEKPAKPMDSELTTSAVRHDSKPPFLNYDNGKLGIMVRVRAKDVRGVDLETARATTKMRLVKSDEFYEFYKAEIGWDGKSPEHYRFQIQVGDEVTEYGPKGIGTGSDDTWTLDPASFKPFRVAGWVPGSVIYQIFPDRFENGSSANDPSPLTQWTSKPTGESRMGGDLAGVAKRIGYLKELGIDAIYFNPIFASPVIHRYETTDFLKVDPQLGSNAEFAKVTKQLEKAGIRTVLDGVFNHVAPDFFAFQDLLKNQENSKYKDWFFVKKFPVKYEDNPNYLAWWGYKSMPKLNVLNPEVREYLLEIPRFWAKHATIHGWRLDVANEVEMGFWRDFRKVVKGIDPNLWIVGEVWGDGTPWLEGDQWDSIMGYQFRDAALRFVAEGNIKADEFGRRLMETYESYPPQVSRNLMNLLSSHDTARFISLCKGRTDLAMLAATLQLTWVGSPSIYYGEELGMLGDQDPLCRAGMEWEQVTARNPMLVHYQKLVAARNASRALQIGKPAILASSQEQNWIAFSRTEGSETAVVVANRSDQAQTISIPFTATKALRDIFSGKVLQPGSDLRVSLEPNQAAVFVEVSKRITTKAQSAKEIQLRSNHEKR